MTTDSRQLTLTDIFLEVLSRYSTPCMQAAIARIKITLKTPECAKLFDIILIRALGYKSSIDKDTVDRAFDCLIEKNKSDIDRTDLNEIEKEQQKRIYETICHTAKSWILDRLKYSGQLIE